MSTRTLHRVITDVLREYQATAQTTTLRERSQRDLLAEHLANTLLGAGWTHGAEVLREAADGFEAACPDGPGPVRFPLCQCTAADELRRMADAAGKDTPAGGESTRTAETCGQCRHPFDPADTRFDGQARYRDTPFCRGCVDRCHESADFAHQCPVCRLTETAPAAPHERDRCMHGTSFNVECGGCDALGQIGGPV